jgi:hypothetical protein
MNGTIISLIALSAVLIATPALAEQVKFVTTGTAGSQHGSDTPAVSDPLQGKPVDAKDEAGHPLTQQPYTDDCKEDRCVRAEKRQLGNTTWQEDRASGLHKTSPSTGGAESRPTK